ncbi:MAG: hypothetical protein ABL888_02215, partial [Pirellulaceae bacterium]
MFFRDSQNRNVFNVIAVTLVLCAFAKWSGYFPSENRQASPDKKPLALTRLDRIANVGELKGQTPNHASGNLIPGEILAILARDKKKSIAEIAPSNSNPSTIADNSAVAGQANEIDGSLLIRNEFSNEPFPVTANRNHKNTAIAVIELLRETIQPPAAIAEANDPESGFAPMPAAGRVPQPTLSPQIGGRDQSVYQLAGQPKLGEVFEPHQPAMDSLAANVPPDINDFQPEPCFEDGYDPDSQINVYEGKYLTPTQRPPVEIGRPWYDLGQLCPPRTFLGLHNPVDSQFVVFGDSRIGVASNRAAADSSTLVAVQTNLFFNWKVTGTERFAMFVSPSSRGLDSTRYLLDEDRGISEFNFNIINGFFEGDFGSIWGGLSNQTMPFDLPFAVGVMPLVFQNGVWMEDNILGVAATIPARNIPAWNVANLDVTFFAGYDNLNSPAFGNDASAGRIYGVASFVEALDGYLEMDYAFLDDRQDFVDRSYHNVGLGFTRRYGRWLSNSARVIANAGQDSTNGNTADGVLLLSENSLITRNPYSRVPYLNFFAGFDRPQSAARAVQSGGVLRNTGILFETDVLTGYPTLD